MECAIIFTFIVCIQSTLIFREAEKWQIVQLENNIDIDGAKLTLLELLKWNNALKTLDL